MNFVEWVQSRLTSHGFSPGMIDGIDGPQTRAAIKAFERANKLPVNGTADEYVVKALRASSSAITPKEQAEIMNRDEPAPTSGSVDNHWPRQSGVRNYYGAVGTNQTHITVPFDMVLAWSKSTRLTRMTLHKRVADSALRVLQNVATTYTAKEREALGLNLFGGSLNVRRMRGGSSYSMHSWGIAIDFDPQRNRLSWHEPKSRLSHADAAPFWQAWEAEGWLSLGRSRNFDWMHVQAANL